MSRKRPEAWQREYPWVPKKKDKTIVQSFAAIRSGVLPIIEPSPKGKPRLVYVDVRTRDGIKQYDRASQRAVKAMKKDAAA